MRVGNSLAVQWLGLQASTAEGMVRPLVRELKSYMTQDHQKKKKERKKMKVLLSYFKTLTGEC